MRDRLALPQHSSPTERDSCDQPAYVVNGFLMNGAEMLLRPGQNSARREHYNTPCSAGLDKDESIVMGPHASADEAKAVRACSAYRVAVGARCKPLAFMPCGGL